MHLIGCSLFKEAVVCCFLSNLSLMLRQLLQGTMPRLRPHIGMAATKTTNCFDFVINVSVLTLLNVQDGAIYIVALS